MSVSYFLFPCPTSEQLLFWDEYMFYISQRESHFRKQHPFYNSSSKTSIVCLHTILPILVFGTALITLTNNTALRFSIKCFQYISKCIW